MLKMQSKQLYENIIKDSKNYPGAQREQFLYESMHVEEGLSSVLHTFTFTPFSSSSLYSFASPNMYLFFYVFFKHIYIYTYYTTNTH